MLISCRKKFLFIANLKTASTSIEATLKPFSEIALTKSEEGKHMPFRVIEQRFGRMFSRPNHNFLIFGVMRDPVDLILSLYNSHTEAKFRDYPYLYTGSMDFNQFITEWTNKNADQIQLQLTRFLDNQGNIGANYIISYERLAEGLNHVASVINVPELRKLRRENVSDQQTPTE